MKKGGFQTAFGQRHALGWRRALLVASLAQLRTYPPPFGLHPPEFVLLELEKHIAHQCSLESACLPCHFLAAPFYSTFSRTLV